MIGYIYSAIALSLAGSVVYGIIAWVSYVYQAILGKFFSSVIIRENGSDAFISVFKYVTRRSLKEDLHNAELCHHYLSTVGSYYSHGHTFEEKIRANMYIPANGEFRFKHNNRTIFMTVTSHLESSPNTYTKTVRTL